MRLTDPALLLMTDFRQTLPLTVSKHRPLDEALADMMRFGVRALFVVHDDLLVGFITSYDIQGERPLQFLQQSTFTRHEDIEVGHIMTPWDALPVLEWPTVEAARVCDLLAVFERNSLTYLVVVETAADRCERVRGLFSRSHLLRQLGASS
ncbi:MAG: CBS domain-containing protein [Steroidobacteraceae bacterium]